MIEIWKDVRIIDGINYQGYYQVSSYGRIRSVDRVIKHPRGGESLRIGKILKPHLQIVTDNYSAYQISLYKNGEHIRMMLHRLIAKVFIPNPNNKPEINHIDSNPLNNKISNLEWCTRKENMEHCFRSGRGNNKKVYQYDLDHNLLKIWDSTMDIQRALGIRNSNISYCCTKKSKQSKGFVWRYEPIKEEIK